MFTMGRKTRARAANTERGDARRGPPPSTPAADAGTQPLYLPPTSSRWSWPAPRTASGALCHFSGVARDAQLCELSARDGILETRPPRSAGAGGVDGGSLPRVGRRPWARVRLPQRLRGAVGHLRREPAGHRGDERGPRGRGHLRHERVRRLDGGGVLQGAPHAVPRRAADGRGEAGRRSRGRRAVVVRLARKGRGHGRAQSGELGHLLDLLDGPELGRPGGDQVGEERDGPQRRADPRMRRRIQHDGRRGRLRRVRRLALPRLRVPHQGGGAPLRGGHALLLDHRLREARLLRAARVRLFPSRAPSRQSPF